MRTVYLIRHGKPAFPGGENMCLGITDIPLGLEGFAQAEDMAAKLPKVTAVFSSPLLRAVQTAYAICGEVQVIPGLQELHMGAWDGLTFRQIREQYPDLYEARGENPDLPVPGAENRTAGLCRFQSSLQEALNQSAGDIAVVAHAGVLEAFLKALGSHRGKPCYGEVIVLTYDGNFYMKEEEVHA